MTKTARCCLAPLHLIFGMLVLLPIAMLCSFVFECGEVFRNTIKFVETPSRE